MSGQANTFEVENPYVYWRTAQEYEQSGDPRGAEIGYKAAVLAADNLPLSEYRRNYHDELSKHLSIPGYRTPPNVGPEELKRAYAELLTLPFAARVRLAMFFMKNSSAVEAQEMCNSALNLKIDDWIQTQELYLDLRQQLESVMRNLQIAKRTGAQNPRHPTVNQQLANKQPKAHSYQLPDITELWNAHVGSSIAAPPPATQQAPAESDQPMSCDTEAMVIAMHACLKRFTDDLASEERKRLGISINYPEYSEEMVRRLDTFNIEQRKNARFYRFRACTALATMSIRGSDGLVELYVVPSREVLNISDFESDYTLRATYMLKTIDSRSVWTIDRAPLYADDMRVSVRNIFKELLQQCNEFLGGASDGSHVGETHPLIKQLSELSEQRTNLAEKIVYQQEMVQNRIARDLHDGVIADLLALKRSFECHTASEQHVISMLEDVSQRLRNICSDLAPRDLEDWGLRTVLTDMVGTVSQRMQNRGQSDIIKDLPELPHQVSLHIYRIVQECLNNMEKHSRATEFSVNIREENGALIISVEDNGVGFDALHKDTRKAAQGGMGLDSIRERTELIRCFYPAQLWVNTRPGAGTKTVLQINVANAK